MVVIGCDAENLKLWADFVEKLMLDRLLIGWFNSLNECRFLSSR
ncbi:hypothetical protein thalar_03023 [Litoreibacter arenae DSM 19593]|uniref:Uncharacterized protein n=1 Tax=Litoreibacter arenae DSM 19593 TaxID=1123360 RepID=S9Q7D7_9RHOB|nr:hypothetical protein thalar_03023 [Litoreibacter arenae DSM 19593]